MVSCLSVGSPAGAGRARDGRAGGRHRGHHQLLPDAGAVMRRALWLRCAARPRDRRDRRPDGHRRNAVIHATTGQRTIGVETTAVLNQQVRASATEVDLADRLVAGDETALGEVFDQYGGFVHALAARVTGDRQAADDITQDVLVTMWERPARFDPHRGTLKAFLGTLAHRRAVDHIRREEARRRREEKVHAELGVTADSADTVLRTVASQLVRDAVATLPTAQRQALELAYFSGHTYRQVADVLGIPEGTAKSRLRLGLRHVADILHPELSERWA
jgi:RNA polymerase sigma factor (sigma-70 family)